MFIVKHWSCATRISSSVSTFIPKLLSHCWLLLMLASLLNLAEYWPWSEFSFLYFFFSMFCNSVFMCFYIFIYIFFLYFDHFCYVVNWSQYISVVSFDFVFFAFLCTEERVFFFSCCFIPCNSLLLLVLKHFSFPAGIILEQFPIYIRPQFPFKLYRYILSASTFEWWLWYAVNSFFLAKFLNPLIFYFIAEVVTYDW